MHCTQFNLDKISIPVLIYRRKSTACIHFRMHFRECIDCNGIASSVVSLMWCEHWKEGAPRERRAVQLRACYAICGKRRTIGQTISKEGTNLLHGQYSWNACVSVCSGATLFEHKKKIVYRLPSHHNNETNESNEWDGKSEIRNTRIVWGWRTKL